MTRSLTKSAVRFARTALALGEDVLPRWGRPRAPHYYTQPQLFALLALKAFWATDYRTVVLRVAEWAELRHVLRLARVPHYSTLCYAEHRLLASPAATKKGRRKACSTRSCARPCARRRGWDCSPPMPTR